MEEIDINSLTENLMWAESERPWRLDGDRILDVWGELVGHVSGNDGVMVVALVNHAEELIRALETKVSA